MNVLKLTNLRMHYLMRAGWVRSVDDVSLDLEEGRALGLAGESGCGKSSMAISIMRLLPANGKIVSGNVLLKGKDLTKLSADEMSKIRGKDIAMISQNAMNALNPVFRIYDQMIETLRKHENIDSSEAKRRVLSLFELVQLPSNRAASYPHEFSGGMRQRAMIAMSLLCNPSLVIADEPTTALDVLVQDQILRTMKDLQTKFGFAMMLITHNVLVIRRICEEMAIMYAGQLVEVGSTKSIFEDSHNPYSMALLRSFPNIIGPISNIVHLPGGPPSLLVPPEGCRFEPRCPYAKEICKTDIPPLIEVAKGHYSRCHFAEDPEIQTIKFKEVDVHV